MITRFCVFTLAAVLTTQCYSQDQLRLPRKELDDAIATAKDAKVQELSARLKDVQAAIKAGAKGYGKTRREAIINARKRQAQLEADLKAAQNSEPPMALEIDKLAVGKIGTLSRLVVPPTQPSSGGNAALVKGSGAAFSASFGRPAAYNVAFEVEVVQIVGPDSVLVTHRGTRLWLRMPTAGLATGQKLTLSEPLKVVGTKTHRGEAVFELAFFEPAKP